MAARHDLTPAALLALALAIAKDYKDRGYSLTLRQLYYQLVAKGHIPSGQTHYKRLGAVLTEARYNGTFPVHYIEDRGRSCQEGDFLYENLDVGLACRWAVSDVKGMPDRFIYSRRWVRQPRHVSVWIEKDALSGVIERPCRELGVSWMACKGYPSVSALDEWIKHTVQFTHPRGRDLGKEVHVLYLGDHDPDGWEIPRSAERNLHRLLKLRGVTMDLTFHRIALNMDQIQEFNPPPFEAKMSSARYQGYIDEHGTDEAWELDALDPEVMDALIREKVEPLFDQDTYDQNQDDVKKYQRKAAIEIPRAVAQMTGGGEGGEE